MENTDNKGTKPELEEKIEEINRSNEKEKEEIFVNLLSEIIVSVTLKEYYSKSGNNLG